MRAWSVVLGLVSLVTCVLAEDTPKAVTPDAAAKMVNEQVVVEMEVKSASFRDGVCFLNSRENHRDASNFTVFIGRDLLAKFKEAKIDDPAAHFKGKMVQVKGKVTLYREKPQITVAKVNEITIIEKKAG